MRTHQNSKICGFVDTSIVNQYLYSHILVLRRCWGEGGRRIFLGMLSEFPERELKQVLRRTGGAQRDNLHFGRTDMSTAIYEYMHIRPDKAICRGR